MRSLITGSTGFIGTALTRFLRAQGDEALTTDANFVHQPRRHEQGAQGFNLVDPCLRPGTGGHSAGIDD